jgi:hypothetical protein
MSENWRPVNGYEGYYEVSDFGAVRRTKGGRGATAGRILRQKKPTRHCDYCRIQLCKGDVKRTVMVHALVAEAFFGRRPYGKLVNHIDLNKLNNAASNLEWVTRKQNQQHAVRLGRNGGRPMSGTKNGRAKLTLSQVTEIRRQRGIIGQRTLAALCGVSKTLIQKIHQGRLWPEDLRIRELPNSQL